VLREGPFRDIWIQPAAGDAGGALGAALSVWHEYLDQPRQPEPTDSMRGALLGPAYDDAEIGACLDAAGASYQRLDDAQLLPRVAHEIAQGKVIGWFRGRMEFGPRALGARSIIGDPRNPAMQSVMNLKIKYRESFRPFAPAILFERASGWFELDRASPYMLIVAPVASDKRRAMTQDQQALFGLEKLNLPRSEIPAVTHVDYSARVQTVHRETNPAFHALLTEFEKQTGCPLCVNTSFNVRGEPIVLSPADAYRCFMRTDMDFLVLEHYLLAKDAQPAWRADTDWRAEFELD
jgi:carbamoyltransferase